MMITNFGGGVTRDMRRIPMMTSYVHDHASSDMADINSSFPKGTTKYCGVCGDIAKSMHFGGLSCDSCKAFFRRSVQNNAYKGFSCPYEKHCTIGVTSRKSCQYCRFEKCLTIGMEMSWVMSEDERKKMMEQRKEKKIKQTLESPEKEVDSSLYNLSEDDRKEISCIINMYTKAYNTIPYEEDNPPQAPGNGGGMPDGSLLGTWMTFCKRLAYFFSLFRDFAELSVGDQSLLLKTALTSAGIIMGSVVYDSKSGKWAAKLNVPSARGPLPKVSTQSVEKLVPNDLMTRVDKFFKKFQQICPDETMAMILILVSLYSPELMGLEARERVQHLQERYIHILQNYVRYKFREKSTVMFPKAIVSLADIRELADRTGQMRIQNRSASMFSSLLQNSASSSQMGCPYSELSLSSNNLQMSADSRALSLQNGPENDPIYQRIMKVVYHMHSSNNVRTPTLLPLIIQILKKWAMNRQNGKASGRSLLGPSRKAQRHSKSRQQRTPSYRPRKGNLKKEAPSFEAPDITIKEEVMDHSEDASLPMWSNCSPPDQSENFASPGSNPEFLDSPQQGFSSPNANVCSQANLNNDLNSNHHGNANIYSPVSHGQIYSPELQYMSPPQAYPAEHSQYPVAITPERNFCSRDQHPVQMSPISPYQQPPHIVTPPLNNTSMGDASQQFDSASYSSMSSLMSPYSSSSSNSSTEDVIPTQANDIFQDDFTDAEVDVIMQLMERVSHFELERGINGVQASIGGSFGSNVTDILPMNLLKELQSKLCSLAGSSPDSGLSSQSPSVSPHFSPHTPSPPTSQFQGNTTNCPMSSPQMNLAEGSSSQFVPSPNSTQSVANPNQVHQEGMDIDPGTSVYHGHSP